MTGLKDKVQHLKALYRDRNLAADGKVLLTHETVYCGEKHTGGGETHPLQHGRYRGARGNRGGYNRLNAQGEDVRP